MIKIAAGLLKGFRVDAPETIRPTEGMVRQAIFNILNAYWEGASVMDGFAGSGALGIEALSRGASSVTFVESDPEALQALEANLERLPPDLDAEWNVIRGDILIRLKELAQQGERFDVVLLDPPYGEESGIKALIELGNSAILSPSSVVCLEHARRNEPPARVGPLQRVKQHRYGHTVLSFYQAA